MYLKLNQDKARISDVNKLADGPTRSTCWPSLLGLGYVFFSCLYLDPHVLRPLAMFMLRSTSLLCYLPCLCLGLHVSAWIYVHMLRSMCLCALCHACVLRSMLVAMPCATLALFCLLISLFLAFWPFRWGVDLDPMV